MAYLNQNMRRNRMNEEILKLLGKAIEEVAKNLIKEAEKNKYDDLHKNVNFQNNRYVSKPYTIFHPAISLKEQMEKQRRKQAEEYNKNNHRANKLGDELPKNPDREAKKAYENYEKSNKDLKDVYREKLKRQRSKS